MSWLSQALNVIKTKLKRLWVKVEPEIENAFSTFLSVFADIAFKAVSEAALKDLTGTQKMKSVLTELKVAVKNAGWVAGETALRTLIESAYSAYKAQNGDKLVAPPNSSEEDVAKIGM
jgi:hypothetical protein